MNYLLINFVLTVVLELIVFFVFFRKDYIKIFLFVLLINFFSWPLAGLVFGYWPEYLLIIELTIFLLEGILIKFLFDTKYKKAFFVSFVANLISVLAGVFFI